MKTKDSRHKVSQPVTFLNEHETSTGEKYKMGTFSTGHGTVIIYTEKKYVSMSFFYEGFQYVREVKAEKRSNISIARFAGKFMRETINNHQHQHKHGH